MTRHVVVLGAAAVVAALLAVSAFAPSASSGCPSTGDPVGRPITDPVERAKIADTFSPETIHDCWPGTAVAGE